jgi:RNA polymerase sigma-70 factor (ECF subfamily)
MASDEDLFREWQQGATGSLEVLVRRYHAPLLAHLTRLTGDPHLAEDLAQETFLRLTRNAQAYHYPRSFQPWLYTIARHLAQNHWQSAYHRYTELTSSVPECRALDPDPAQWLELRERHADLLAALLTLSLEQREVLSLRFGQDMSIEETAFVLGVPPGTVKSRTFTALHRLRQALIVNPLAGADDDASNSADKRHAYG